MENLQALHYQIINAIWKAFREDLDNVADIHDADDPRWTKIVKRYQAIADSAPASVKAYASDMMLVHVAALESKWRWKNG